MNLAFVGQGLTIGKMSLHSRVLALDFQAPMMVFSQASPGCA